MNTGLEQHKGQLFHNNAVIWSKVTVQTFIILQKIAILNKCCSFELSIH